MILRHRLYVHLLPLLILTLPGRAESTLESTNAGFSETSVMAEETRLVMQLLETVHYKNEQIDREGFTTLLTDYMAELDTHRLFFLNSDRVFFVDTYGDTLGRSLRVDGSLTVPFHVFDTYKARAETRLEWVLERLAGEFDFETQETYVFDRSEAAWPQTTEESDDIWIRRLKYELLQFLLNEETIDGAREKVRKRYERLSKNLDEIGMLEIQELFLSTLARMYDPHSTFFSAETLEDFSISMRLSLVGIGALLAQEDDFCVVKELIPGGPASLSRQLAPNDRIVGVAQGTGESVDVIGMSLRKIVKKIRGEKGTVVRLMLLPGDAVDSSVRRELILTRDVVQLNASRAKSKIYEVPAPNGTISLGVIDVPSFYGPVEEADKGNEDRKSVTQDVEELLIKLANAGVEGIVLDFRHNGGGLLSEAVDMTGLFIRQGPVVQVRDSDGQIRIKPDLDPKIAYDGPLIVLTSHFSASASEIVAGALQNYGRALIIGSSSTHGKGTVQAVLEMKSFIPRRTFEKSRQTGAAKLTVQKFYLPNGFSTQNKGVIPDISLPSVDDFLPIGESDLPNAMAWDTIRPARFAGFSIQPDFIENLRLRSMKRQDSMEEFHFLNQRIDWFREKQTHKAITLNLEKRRTQKVIDEAFRDEMDSQQTRLAELNYPAEEELLASVLKTRVSSEETLDADTASKGVEPEVAEEDDTPPPFDIHLRESLRIMADAIDFSHDPNDWTNIKTLTAQRTAKSSGAF